MPPVNHAVLASAGVIAVSVAVAAAIAVYESPEVRRVAEDLRRRIAIALHSLGENIDPGRRDPLFNRPEDAEGFLQSHTSVGADQGVDADDETRRRQREELLYWNSQLEARRASEQRTSPPHIPRRPSSRGSSFEDFLQQDKTAERGTFVFNTGADVSGGQNAELSTLRRRGFVEGVRGLSASMIANPFSDEYGIELDHHEDREAEPRRLVSPPQDEDMTDIYNATPRGGQSVVSDSFAAQSKPVVPDVLFDFDSQARSQSATMEGESRPMSTASTRSVTLERELEENEFMTAGQEDRADAYASIQAWAQDSSNTGFYSPLPDSPAAPLSEPELISNNGGDVTPTDSASVAGSGEDLGNDATSTKTEDYDVMSEDSSDDGMATPNSWSEVGSQISESDSAVRA